LGKNGNRECDLAGRISLDKNLTEQKAADSIGTIKKGILPGRFCELNVMGLIGFLKIIDK